MEKESSFLENPFNCNMLYKRSGCIKKGNCEHNNKCRKAFLKYQQEHWNNATEFTKLQIELIKNYCDYEWDSDVQKELQKWLDHWITSNNIDKIPFTLSHDFWCDFLTSVFDVHSEYILKTLENKLNLN